MSTMSELNRVERAILTEAEAADLGISLTSDALPPLRAKRDQLKALLKQEDIMLYEWIYGPDTVYELQPEPIEED
jgi:hypothetical protein